MSKQQTVTINNVAYDARTGMRVVPVAKNRPGTMSDVKRVAPAANAHHQVTQRSKTLRRRTLESPVNVRTKTAPVSLERSQMIRRFASDISPTQPQRQARQEAPDIAPSLHPIQQKILAQKQVAPTPMVPQPRPASEIKQSVVAKALAESKPAKPEKESFMKKHPKLLSITSGVAILLVLGGYLTYTNLPNLSVKVAAMQAGIAASFPTYQPSGYSVDGPVSYKEGEVSMKFDANAGPQNFTITQQRSAWDSSALLENYVSQVSKEKYNTYSDSGLTVYVYGTNAAWVNGGILHTIEGDAPLTNQQIRKIATSM